MPIKLPLPVLVIGLVCLGAPRPSVGQPTDTGTQPSACDFPRIDVSTAALPLPGSPLAGSYQMFWRDPVAARAQGCSVETFEGGDVVIDAPVSAADGTLRGRVVVTAVISPPGSSDEGPGWMVRAYWIDASGSQPLLDAEGTEIGNRPESTADIAIRVEADRLIEICQPDTAGAPSVLEQVVAYCVAHVEPLLNGFNNGGQRWAQSTRRSAAIDDTDVFELLDSWGVLLTFRHLEGSSEPALLAAYRGTFSLATMASEDFAVGAPLEEQPVFLETQALLAAPTEAGTTDADLFARAFDRLMAMRTVGVIAWGLVPGEEALLVPVAGQLLEHFVAVGLAQGERPFDIWRSVAERARALLVLARQPRPPLVWIPTTLFEQFARAELRPAEGSQAGYLTQRGELVWSTEAGFEGLAEGDVALCGAAPCTPAQVCDDYWCPALATGDRFLNLSRSVRFCWLGANTLGVLAVAVPSGASHCPTDDNYIMNNGMLSVPWGSPIQTDPEDPDEGVHYRTWIEGMGLDGPIHRLMENHDPHALGDAERDSPSGRPGQGFVGWLSDDAILVAVADQFLRVSLADGTTSVVTADEIPQDLVPLAGLMPDRRTRYFFVDSGTVSSLWRVDLETHDAVWLGTPMWADPGDEAWVHLGVPGWNLRSDDSPAALVYPLPDGTPRVAVVRYDTLIGVFDVP